MQTREEQLFGCYESILKLPRPRRVHVKAIGWIILGSLPPASVFMIYAGVQTIRPLHQIGAYSSTPVPAIFAFVFAAILIAISSATYWKVRRDRALLRGGELAIGVVTHQKWVAVRGGRGGTRKQSRVRYRFKDPAGELFQGTGTDYSRRLRVDMTVPVFYKLEDPEKNVSICTAVCELRNH
jgi:hypothetical protein